jgi:hypothetical protein
LKTDERKTKVSICKQAKDMNQHKNENKHLESAESHLGEG